MQREERKRGNAREKERVERDLERQKAAELEEREREREYRREREMAPLQKEAQFELIERERRQREMHDMEAIRAARAREGQAPVQAHPQHMHHLHAHHPHSPSGTPLIPPQAPPHAKTSSKQAQMAQMVPVPLPVDMPPEYQHQREREARQGPSKGSGPLPPGMGMPQQRPPQIIHQQVPHPHQMPPGPHMRPHLPPEMYPGMPIGYPRRPTPPPFHDPAMQAMFPRPGSPTAVARPIRHLGTFVYPRTPFPFLDFPAAHTESGAPSDPLDIRATILLPSRFIPLTRPSRPRIWGGALIPAVPALTGAQRQLCVQFCGTTPQFGRPWPEEVREGRRVYTDDSDLFLCALHAGWVSWSAARKARREGRDLKMEVRLTREARYIGGVGHELRRREIAEIVGQEMESLGAEDDGSSLLSSGWGNGHDGAGVEILRAEFVQVSWACGLQVRGTADMAGTGGHCAFPRTAEPFATDARVRGAAGCVGMRSAVGQEAAKTARTVVRGWCECGAAPAGPVGRGA